MSTDTPRTLPGLGLTGAYPANFKGWDTGVNANWLLLSALSQLALNQAPSAAMPITPIDGMIVVDPATQEICIRDAGAWVRVAPASGWLAVFDATVYRFTGSDWESIVAPGFPLQGVAANGTDINTLNTNGVWAVPTAVAAATMTNLPVAEAGTLYVGRANATGPVATQLFIASSGRMFKRASPGGTFGAWTETVGLNSPAFTGTPSVPSLKLGNVASADVNTLDHYEEGTWLPTLIGATTPGTPVYGARSGVYTRIGDTVSVSGNITLTSKGGMAGAMRLGGLPFAANANLGATGGLAIGYVTAMTLGAGSWLSGSGQAGLPYVSLYKLNISAGANALVASEIADTFAIYFSLTFKV